jgi:hypothetical protein
MSVVEDRITEYFVNGDYNCAISSLLILSEVFELPLEQQVIDAATGMNGAGRSQAQCGLVEGTLMFLGILGKKYDLSQDEIVDICYDYAAGFTNLFGSLNCRELRPEGFKSENPPHLCRELANSSVHYGIQFIKKQNIIYIKLK